MLTHRVISAEMAQDVVARLYQLKSAWHSIRPGLSVLGTPLWLRGNPNMDTEIANRVLDKYFGDLYQAVFGTLENLLEAPVRAMEGYSRPGFHIFESLHGEDPVVSPSEVHYDSELFAALFDSLPADKKRFKKEEFFDPDTTLSFTLALQVPKNGTGLFVWPTLQREEIMSYTTALDVNRFAAMACLLSRHQREFVDYRVGELVKHNGQQVHWIAPMQLDGRTAIAAGEKRITLQGQGIKHDGVWEIFW